MKENWRIFLTFRLWNLLQHFHWEEKIYRSIIFSSTLFSTHLIRPRVHRSKVSVECALKHSHEEGLSSEKKTNFIFISYSCKSSLFSDLISTHWINMIRSAILWCSHLSLMRTIQWERIIFLERSDAEFQDYIAPPPRRRTCWMFTNYNFIPSTVTMMIFTFS